MISLSTLNSIVLSSAKFNQLSKFPLLISSSAPISFAITSMNQKGLILALLLNCVTYGSILSQELTFLDNKWMNRLKHKPKNARISAILYRKKRLTINHSYAIHVKQPIIIITILSVIFNVKVAIVYCALNASSNNLNLILVCSSLIKISGKTLNMLIFSLQVRTPFLNLVYVSVSSPNCAECNLSDV